MPMNPRTQPFSYPTPLVRVLTEAEIAEHARHARENRELSLSDEDGTDVVYPMFVTPSRRYEMKPFAVAERISPRRHCLGCSIVVVYLGETAHAYGRHDVVKVKR